MTCHEPRCGDGGDGKDSITRVSYGPHGASTGGVIFGSFEFLAKGDGRVKYLLSNRLALCCPFPACVYVRYTYQYYSTIPYCVS